MIYCFQVGDAFAMLVVRAGGGVMAGVFIL